MTAKRPSTAKRPPAPRRPLAGDGDADGFEVLVVTQRDDVVVSVRGEVDLAAAPRLWDAVDEAIRTAPPRLVIDLHDATFVDSAGLTVFIRAFKRLRHDGGELILRSPRTNTRKVLNITGLDTVITIES